MDLHDHSPGGDLLFPEELEETEFRLLDTSLYAFDDGEPQNGGPPDSIDGQPRFGKWIHGMTAEGEMLIAAPGELIQELQRLDADQGDMFRVTRCQKSGPEQSDSYEVNAEELEHHQARFTA